MKFRTSGLLVMSMVMILLAGPLAFSTGKSEQAPNASAKKVSEPQYGGSLSMFFVWAGGADPASADVLDGHWSTNVWTTPHIEYLLTTDFEKYGPRGNGEFDLKVVQGIPDQYMTGQLAESWEVSPDRIVFHIRPGIMWQGREGIMKPREYTAEDAAFNLNRYFHNAKVGGPAVFPFIKSIHAEGNTCVVETTNFYAGWPDLIGWGNYTGQYAPEAVEAGASDWENAVGTGPFKVKEYVRGSYVRWERNPNYWKKTTINGKGYRLPFIDELTWPIIPDESTRIAGLRTGKLDYYWGVPNKYEDTLDTRNPELVKAEFFKSGQTGLALNTTNKYFRNRNIRRAMMIGTNLEAIEKAIWQKGRINSFPISAGLPTTLFTPMEELPASAQELFHYDPQKARQMLAAEGYPDGFDVELIVCPGMESEDLDAGSMIADQWARFGVKVDLKVLEPTAFFSAMYSKDYKDVLMRGFGAGYPLRAIHEVGWSGHAVNTALYENEYFTKQDTKIQRTIDTKERNALLKEFGVWFLEEVAYIPFADRSMLTYYGSWIKNYYGEADAANCNLAPFLATMWIDQELKKKLGR